MSELKDEADQLTKESTGNMSKAIRVPISESWAIVYASRKEISRASVGAKAKASNSGANSLSGMLGLPLQANTVAVDAEVWLPKMEVADALKAGTAQYEGDPGCQKTVGETLSASDHDNRRLRRGLTVTAHRSE